MGWDCIQLAGRYRALISSSTKPAILHAGNTFATFQIQSNRSVVLEQVVSKLPDCLAWAVTCYGAPSHLQFGNNRLSSSCGLHQGCPLSGHLYGLAQQPIVEAIEAEVPGLAAHVWAHDDGNAVGSKEELQQVVDIVSEARPPPLSC